jgi:hypothetical protein
LTGIGSAAAFDLREFYRRVMTIQTATVNEEQGARRRCAGNQANDEAKRPQ